MYSGDTSASRGSASGRERSRDLWSIAVEEREAVEDEKRRAAERQGKGEGQTSVFFLGSGNSGKTTLILRFLDRMEQPKPTCALDYTYGRRSRGANLAKDVTHLWELGGGNSLSMLVDIPISIDTICLLSIVLVVDLSKPAELWTTLDTYITKLRSRVSSVMTELKKCDPTGAERLRRQAWKKFGSTHPDKDLLTPLPIPFTILGSKYDIFQDFDPERRKIICKTLRFLAHMNGASLYFVSSTSDILVNRVKQILSSMAFGTAQSRTMSMDYTKPLIVAVGTDALGQIGAPSMPAGEMEKINAKNPHELWKQSYCGFFPQVTQQSEEADPCKDTNYTEPEIDSMRALKNEELEKYRRDSERRVKELARQAKGGGGGGRGGEQATAKSNRTS